MKVALMSGLAFTLACASISAVALQQVSIADFSSLQPGDALPANWEQLTISSIRKHTEYKLVSPDGVTVLRADADDSMSGLVRKIDVDPRVTPWMHWRWKVERPNDKSDLHSKRGDDFAARIYVFFDFDIDNLPFFERLLARIARAIYGDRLPLAALCYVWANNQPTGTTAWNPHTKRVRTIVASSGSDNAGHWISVERNVSDDYREAFGDLVPRITGVAIATDSDDTGAHSLAWYGDIAFSDQARQSR